MNALHLSEAEDATEDVDREEGELGGLGCSVKKMKMHSKTFATLSERFPLRTTSNGMVLLTNQDRRKSP